jgi:phospholipase/carboxylesterase
MFLHGLGDNGEGLIDLAGEFVDILPNACFLSPHAPFDYDMGFLPGARQWFSMLRNDEEYYLQGVKKAEPFLHNYIDDQLERFQITEDKVILIGFSQGTIMALHVGLHRKSDGLKIIGFSGTILGAHELDAKKISKPRICLIHGEQDNVVPIACLTTSQQKLTQLGLEVESHRIKGLGHSINQPGITAARSFIQRQQASGSSTFT